MVGVVGLVFEGNQLVIPIQQCVRAEDRDRFPAAFRWTMFGILVLLAVFGFVCRAALGPGVSIILPTSLPTTQPWVFLTTAVHWALHQW